MLFRLIRQHELASESPLITLTLQSPGRGEVNAKERKVIAAQGRAASAYNPTQQADEEVRKILR